LIEEDSTMNFTKVYDNMEAARKELQCKMEGESTHFRSCVKEYETFDFEIATAHVNAALRAKMLICELNRMELEGRTEGLASNSGDKVFKARIQIQDNGTVSITDESDEQGDS